MQDDPLIVTRGGKPFAVLLPIEDADLETVMLSVHPKFTEIIRRSRARRRAEGAIPSEEVRRRLGLTVRPAG